MDTYQIRAAALNAAVLHHKSMSAQGNGGHAGYGSIPAAVPVGDVLGTAVQFEQYIEGADV